MAEEMIQEEVVLQDLDKVEALVQLDDLVRMGVLNPTRAIFARHKYEELHGAIMGTLSNGKRLLAESAVLDERLKNEKEDLEKVIAEAAEDETTLGILHEDVEQAESEAIICREREMELLGEEADLVRIQKEFEERIREIEREHAAALSPQILQLKIDFQDLTKNNLEDAAKIERYKAEIGATQISIAQTLDTFKRLVLEKKEGKKFLLCMDGYPEKLRKQADSLSSSIKGLHLQEQQLMDKIKEYDYDLSNLHNATRELNEGHTISTMELEKLRHYTEQKEQIVGEMKKDIALNSVEADQYLADRVTLDMQLRSVLADLKLEQDQLAARVMEKDKMLHRVKHAEHFLKQIQATIPSLEIEKQKVNRKLVIAEHERKRVSLSVAELKKEMDIRMHNYLQIENLQKETVLTLHSGYKKVEHLEKEVIHTIELEYAQQQQMGELASLREHMCRLLSSKNQLKMETEEKIRAIDMIIESLQRKEQDLQHSFKKFTKLYNLLRSQRNKFAQVTQLNSLTIAELKEKSTLLEVEHNMLQNEVLNKDQLLIRIRKDLTINIQNQFHLRSELIKCIESLSRTKERANEYVIEVERLRSIISNTEKEMTAFRVQYEMWVITRNHIGISLIDRNDELCILFEKSHTQEELLKHSQIELVKRDNEIACLKPQLSDLERAIILCYKFIPQAVNIFRTKKQLKHQLRLVIEEGERLSELVEQPENTARWRLLVGTDTKEVELVAKISHIEQRLSETANRELQKDLILEEVTALSADLKKHAAEGWEENIALEKRVNYYQQRMRTVTQQMMATVSELSLCQAMAMNVQQEKETLLKTLEEAYSKFTVAEPPTEDAQKEWVRMEKTLFLNELAETNFKQNALKTGKSWSTVEQRPNAYISEEYGLPKPFGAHAPFKP